MSNTNDEYDFDEEEFDFDEDFEVINEDDSDDDSDDDLVENEKIYEEFAVPFFSVYAKKLPDKYNPNKLFTRESILLFNPFDKVEPFKNVNPKGINLDMLSNYLIFDSRPISIVDEFGEITKYKKILTDSKNFICSLQEAIASSEDNLSINNSYDNDNDNEYDKKVQKNKFNQKSKNKYTPKN
jgi:hypothetical protein